MLKNFFKYNFKRLARYFEENKKSRILVAFLMILAVAGLAIGIYFLTKNGLAQTQTGTDPFMNKAAPLYIYQIFLLIINFLIFVSSLIYGLINFFKSENEDWIVASPKYLQLAWAKLIRGIIDSSWPIIILALPLIIAIKTVFNLSFLSVIIAFLSVIFLAISTSILAICLVFVLSYILKSLNFNNFKALFVLAGVIVLSIGILVWNKIVGVDLSSIFQFKTAKASLEAMEENFSIFSSGLAAMAIYNLQIQNISLALKYLLGLVGLFASSIFLFAGLKRNYLSLWQKFQEGNFEAKKKTKKKKKRFNFKGGKYIILEKELLTFLRSPSQLMWFSFLALLLFAQVGVVSLLGKYEEVLGGLTGEKLISSMQLGIILFFVSAIILRFVFPSFSQESKTSWIIGSSPINLKKVYKEKLIFFSISVLMASVIAFLIHFLPFGLRIEALIAAAILIPSVITLVIIGLSMGVVFINFRTVDPQKISTSGSGIGFVLISLLYSSISGFLYYIILTTGKYYLLIFPFIALAIIYKISKKIAFKKLKEIEFI